MKAYKQLKANIVLDFYMDEICKFRGFKKSDILTKSRKREYADVRALVAYLAKNQLPEINLCQIANYFKHAEHATVLHSLKKIETLRKFDKGIIEVLKHCEKLCFSEGVMINSGLVKVDNLIFSKRILGNIFDVFLLRSESYDCKIAHYDRIYINKANIFDAIIILQNIDNDPLGTLINSLKN